MRSHRVPSFPDPSLGGGFPLRTSGINFESPAYTSAFEACAKLQPGGNHPPPPVTESQEAEMTAKASCVREHGVPNFPDPTFGPGGEGVGIDPPSNWSICAPAVELAKKACSHIGIAIPGPGVG
jgi:hypothetical protein